MAKIKGNKHDNDLFGRSGNDSISGLAGDDFIFGAAGNDTIKGGGGNDEIAGGKGNDTLKGGAGDDVLVGGKGNDILIGGVGRDIMTGGAGDDIFRFMPGLQSEFGGADVITDFEQIAGDGGDKLQIPEGSIFTFNAPLKMNGITVGWYMEYTGAAGAYGGWALILGLFEAPDYEFV